MILRANAEFVAPRRLVKIIMHPGWLVESASIWGYHGAMMATSRQPFPVEAVHEYWMRNRTRFDAWNSMFTLLKPRLRSSNPARRAIAWTKLTSIVEEILMAEPLCRVSVSVAVQLEHRQIDSDARAILHNVFQSHLEVRERSLGWILEGVENGIEAASQLNRLRAYLEHWTDLLLGFFADEKAAQEYAFSPSRVADFSSEYGTNHLGEASGTVWSLLLAGNRKWIDTYCISRPVFPKLNHRVCQAALAMVNPVWFDSLGVLPDKTSASISNNIDFVDRAVESLVDGTWMRGSQVNAADFSESKPVNRI